MSLRLITLGSGSSGNAALLSYGSTTILLDAGISYRRLLSKLSELEIPLQSIRAIFITHDHADHIRSAVKIAVNHFIPLYCSREVAYRMLNHRFARHSLSAFLRHLVPREEGAVMVGEMRVEAFPVPHDATDNLGFTISTPAGTLSLVTDIGHVTADIEKAISRSDYIVFESNYDSEMLWRGTYPTYLKERISNGFGHLSNREATEALQRCYHPKLKFIALCHLSQDNNTPHLAYREMAEGLKGIGVEVGRDLEMYVLPRYDTACFFLQRELEEVESPLWTLGE